jgi:hypothetical protein
MQPIRKSLIDTDQVYPFDLEGIEEVSIDYDATIYAGIECPPERLMEIVAKLNAGRDCSS